MVELPTTIDQMGRAAFSGENSFPTIYFLLQVFVPYYYKRIILLYISIMNTLSNAVHSLVMVFLLYQ